MPRNWALVGISVHNFDERLTPGLTLSDARLTDMRPAEDRCLLMQLYSIITTLLSIIEKDSGFFDSLIRNNAICSVALF